MFVVAKKGMTGVGITDLVSNIQEYEAEIANEES